MNPIISQVEKSRFIGEIIDTALEVDLSPAKVIMMIDGITPGGLWDENCPACHSKLSSEGDCRVCGWGITHHGEHSANLAEADCGLPF